MNALFAAAQAVLDRDARLASVKPEWLERVSQLVQQATVETAIQAVQDSFSDDVACAVSAAILSKFAAKEGGK